jgi:hypothetical protein
VLRYLGVPAGRAEIGAWCGQTTRGCVLDLAIDGLRDAGFDVDELTRGADEEVASMVTDADDPLPAIVTLQDPRSTLAMDHAVVVTDVRTGFVEVMDPALGSIRRVEPGLFWSQWESAGARAFVIHRP